MVNKIVTDVVFEYEGARSALQRIKSAVTDADGTISKFKAGASEAFATLGANIGLLAVGGAAALATFGAKAVGVFTSTAKAAIDGAAATGLNVEQQSRWIAVADDMGISAEQLTTGLGRISKTLDDTKWSKYGIDTRDAGGKARDTNEILLDTFDMLGKITNETERARVGNDLFGRGFVNIAPLIGKTRAEYEQYLGSVEKGQVITAEEAATAEKTRLALDSLHDSIGEVTLAVGQALAPAVAEYADDAANAVTVTEALIEKIDDLSNSAPKASGALGWLTDKARRAFDPLYALRKTIGDISDLLPKNSSEWRTSTATMERAGAQAEMYVGQLEEMAARQDAATTAVGYTTTAADLYAESLQYAGQAAQDEAAREAAAIDALEKKRKAIDAVRQAEERRLSTFLRTVGGDIGIRAAQSDALAAFNDPSMSFDQKLQSILGAANQIAAIRQTELESRGNRVDANVQAQLLKDALGSFATTFGQIFLGDNATLALGDALADALRRYQADITAGQAGQTTIPFRGSYATGTSRVPGADGTPGWAIVHGGERITSVGGSSSSSTTISIPVTVNAGIGTDGHQVGRQIVEAIDSAMRGGQQFSPFTLRAIRG